MPSRTSICMVVSILFAANPSESLLAAPTAPEWLRGIGKDLEMRLKGEVFEADGHAATDVVLTGNLNGVISNLELASKVDGHRFEIWIPVNQLQWYSMWLKAASAAGDRVAYQKLNAYELRQAASDGIKWPRGNATVGLRRKRHYIYYGCEFLNRCD
ncbi:MAG TPA: hypothetical protein VHC22_23325 [Pirellulales bacterium]|nr:hypothetical protein [Pirellulales bacterium]